MKKDFRRLSFYITHAYIATVIANKGNVKICYYLHLDTVCINMFRRMCWIFQIIDFYFLESDNVTTINRNVNDVDLVWYTKLPNNKSLQLFGSVFNKSEEYQSRTVIRERRTEREREGAVQVISCMIKVD